MNYNGYNERINDWMRKRENYIIEKIKNYEVFMIIKGSSVGDETKSKTILSQVAHDAFEVINNHLIVTAKHTFKHDIITNYAQLEITKKGVISGHNLGVCIFDKGDKITLNFAIPHCHTSNQTINTEKIFKEG